MGIPLGPSSSVSGSVSDHVARSLWIWDGITLKNWLIACDVLGIWPEDEATTSGGAGTCGVIGTAVEYCSGIGWDTMDRPDIDGVKALATGPTLKSRVWYSQSALVQPWEKILTYNFPGFDQGEGEVDMCVRLTSYGKFEDIARVGVLCHGKTSDSLRENDLEKKKKKTHVADELSRPWKDYELLFESKS